jgi:predicted dienelactone hydrolase
MRLALRWWFVGAMCWGSLGCGGDDLGPVEFGGPDEVGPYAVGITEMEIDDGQGTGRTLPIMVWYPARHRSGSEVFDYVLGLQSLEVVRFTSPLGGVEDAPADPRGPFPIVLFSHGNGGVRQQSFYMTEWLASHGFIVAAPDHVGNTILDELIPGASISMVQAALLRPTDMSRTLDAVLLASEEGGNPISGAADDSRVGIAGHSFGGFTSFRIAGATIDQALLEAECEDVGGRLCNDLDTVTFPVSQRDERVMAALPQAPGGAMAMLPGMGFADVAVPTFIQAGNADLTTPLEPEAEEPFAQLPAPAHLLVIDQAGHFTFSDMCRLIENLNPLLLELVGDVNDVLDDGCGEANIPWPEAHAHINAYATDFFHATVAGTEGFGGMIAVGYPHPAAIASFESR